MELGATVCTPKAPACDACPVATLCEAFRLGLQLELPRNPKKKAVPHVDVAVGLVWRKGRLLIAKRLPNAMLGGLWEFPGGKREPGETLEEAVRREVREETVCGEGGALVTEVGPRVQPLPRDAPRLSLHERPRRGSAAGVSGVPSGPGRGTTGVCFPCLVSASSAHWPWTREGNDE